MVSDTSDTGAGTEPLADAGARRAAVDPAQNVVLEASAGTGKTRVLVERYVNLLRAGVEPDHILARDREIVETREHNKWLFRPPGGETYEEVARRAGAWYATLDRDTVVTAHGGTARASAST